MFDAPGGQLGMTNTTTDQDRNDAGSDVDEELDESQSGADEDAASVAATDSDDEDDSNSDSDSDSDSGGDDADTEFDPERLKAYATRKNRENRKLRQDNKRLKAAEKELGELKRAQMSKEERLAAELKDAGESAGEIRAELNRLKVQKEYPQVDDDLIELVGDSDLESMLSRAKVLSERIGKNDSTPKRRKPAADALSGGSDPSGGEAFDVDSMLKDIPRY